MTEEKTMRISESNLDWLGRIKKRLLLSSRDDALTKVKKLFKHLKLENEF